MKKIFYVFILSMVYLFAREESMQSCKIEINPHASQTQEQRPDAYEATKKYMDSGDAHRDIENTKANTVQTFDKAKEYTKDKYYQTKEFIDTDGRQAYEKTKEATVNVYQNTKSWISDTIDTISK